MQQLPLYLKKNYLVLYKTHYSILHDHTTSPVSVHFDTQADVTVLWLQIAIISHWCSTVTWAYLAWLMGCTDDRHWLFCIRWTIK